jgi:hypothetical protein
MVVGKVYINKLHSQRKIKHIAILLRAVAKSFLAYAKNKMNKIKPLYASKKRKPNPQKQRALSHTLFF